MQDQTHNKIAVAAALLALGSVGWAVASHEQPFDRMTLVNFIERARRCCVVCR